MMSGNRHVRTHIVDIVVKIRRRSDRVVTVEHGRPSKRAWLPLSQCELSSNGDGTHTASLPEWLAREKGMI